MWKKIMISLCALAGSLTVGLAYYNMKMNAVSSYLSGGSLTGRVNIAPNGISGANIGMQKGDKIYIGANNPYTNKPMGWQLLYHDVNYPIYNVTVSGAVTTIKTMSATLTQTGSTSAWYAMTTENVGKDSCFSGNPSYDTYYNNMMRTMKDLTEYKPYHTIMNLESEMQTAKQANLVKPADLSVLQETISKTKGATGTTDTAASKKIHERNAYMLSAVMKDASIFLPDFRLLFSPSLSVYSITGGFHMTAKDLKYSENYLSAFTVNAISNQAAIPFSGGLWSRSILADGTRDYVNASSAIALRGASMLNMDDVVFAVSPGNTNAIGSVSEVSLPSNYTNIYTATANDKEMKLRLYNSADPLTVQLTDILHRNGHSVSTVEKNTTLKIKAKAENRNTTVSAILFKDGEFVYYRPLDGAKGDTQDYLYDFDTTGIDVGSYQLAIVNEEYDDTTTAPAYSSYLSDVLPITIVEPLSNLSFTPRTDLEYGKNVNVGDTVGMISSQNGAGTITYSIISDPAYPSEYQNVTLGSDGKTVIVNGNALHAGTYHFKIQAQDQNNDPDPALEISASITVSKTNLTLAFNDPNQTKKSIAQAQVGWSETTTVTPNNGVKTIYSIISTQGNISTSDIAIDPNSGALSYSGNGAYGKITIQANADDDPAGGYDDYNSVTATKEIVVYRAVDGSITPDAQSTDANIPTFSASDPNAKPNGTIGTVKGTLGTPDNGINGAITYSYEIKQEDDFGSFEVNATTGVIRSKVNLGVKEHHITLIVKDQWSEKEIPLTIKIEQANAEDLQFYENSTSNTVINTKTVNFTDTNVSVYATVKGSTNTNPVTYSLKAGEPSNVIEVNGASGGITIKGAGTVIIEASKQGVSGQSDAKAELTFTVTAAAQNFIFTDSTLLNEMPKNAATGKYSTHEETYSSGKTFNVYTAGYPSGNIITYQLKSGSSNDVINVEPDGTIHILNASRSGDIGHVSIEATSHDPNGNYTDKTIELPITVNRGTRTVAFADDPIYVVNGNGTVTPNILVDGVSDTSGLAVIEVDVNESSTAWTNNGMDIQYSYGGDDGKDIPLQVSLPGNRNYENTDGKGTLHILGTNEAMLTVSTPGKIIYGDHFTIRSTQDDSVSSNVQYTFTVNDTTYISNPIVNGKQAEFDALKYSGNTETTITVTRTADGEVPLSKRVKVKVLPKPILIVIEDKQKLKGEANPSFTVQDFSSQLVSWNGIADVIQSNDIKLSTVAGQSSQAGNYPIRGDQSYLNKTYPNYSFTFEDGSLMITEEHIADDWYHLERDDGQAYQGEWTNQDVNIVSDHNEYIHLSLDQSTWKTQIVSVNKEGKNEIGFWMKKDSGAITSEKKETIRIDKKAPMVKSIKATDTNNKLQDIINKLSGGIFFQPGTRFDITTSDEYGSLEVSGTQTIAYKIYQVDTVSKTQTLVKEDTIGVNNEQASITIDETRGTYQVCVIPSDQAGNEGKEDCHEITLKKINVDGDEDDDPDFNDPDGDGCPDLNIVLGKDSDGFYIKLNVDKDHDGLPELNIDSDGDGIADINVDQDGDGKADLNIVKITKWNPSVCVNDQEEEYCTDASLIPNINVDLDHDGRPDINIDLDQDGIPDIDIDSDGDGKADINIDSDQDGTADERIVKLKEWKIDKQIFTYQGVKFQTMTDIKVEEKQQLSDKDITIENKDGSTFSSEMELKVEDVSAYRKAEVKEQAKELIEEEQEVKIVYEIKLLKNGTEVTPKGILKIRIPIPEGSKNAVLIRRKKEGGYEEIKASIEEGYFVYESEELGIVAIIADIETNESDVKGSYYPGADSGGALTGDTTNIAIYIAMGCVSLGLINLILFKKTKRKISVE